ncbi:protein PLASTID MOVEMENT IMPAIRED 1-RELATED 2-like [Diospyros lotus]|uniref:protein PLASTID MOVEMENT IMPAIRED 1-RELATED 2-like n=1 Tax=Diospyros lotus TaxID=55363 RepID=UPI002255C7F5|nr:protein PLASTID MOVEMENT IMPAIRED 1-RELATED 2-like [Diospyros lotus]
MMLSKPESRKSNGGQMSQGQLLHDIEEISRALYLHKTPRKTLIAPSNHQSKLSFANQQVSQKEEKSSIWNWKPLKALSHIWNRRFSCCFFLHVHSIEGIPANFNDISLRVHWKRKDEVLRTLPARVDHGVAEFEETLMHRCFVHGRRIVRDNSAKYDPKLFVLYATVVGASGLDLGKHWIDLTRLLPLTFEEMEREGRSGKWTTSFKLTGRAEGAVLNVSFGFSVMADNMLESGGSRIIPKLLKEGTPRIKDGVPDVGQGSGSGRLRRVGSVPNGLNRSFHRASPSLDMEMLNKTFQGEEGTKLGPSIAFLYQKLDVARSGTTQGFNIFCEPGDLLKQYFTQPSDDNVGKESVNSEASLVEPPEMELPTKEKLNCPQTETSTIEIIDVSELFKDDETAFYEEMACNSTDQVCHNLQDPPKEDITYEGDGVCAEFQESAVEELDPFSHYLSISEAGDEPRLSSSSDVTELTKPRSAYTAGKLVRSISLDDVSESIADDFLKKLGLEQNGTESEPDSPRELLLRQFEEESLGSGSLALLNLEEEESVEFGDASDDIDERTRTMIQPLRGRRKANLLDLLETHEVGMREEGVNERAFWVSPVAGSGGFGSPIYLTPEEPSKLSSS